MSLSPARRRLVSLAVGTVLAAVLAVALLATGGSGTTNAPRFSLPRLGGGDAVALPLRKGGHQLPVVLTFFAAWCGPCHSELPALAAAEKMLPGIGSRLAVIGIDGNDDPTSGLAFARASGVDFPVGKDADSVIAPEFDVPGYPATVFVDSHNQVVHVVRGPISVSTFRLWAGRIELPAS